MNQRVLHLLFLWSRAAFYACCAIGLLSVLLRQHTLPDISLRYLTEIEQMIVQKNLSAALTRLRAATAIAAEDEQTFYLQGVALQQTGDIPGAIRAYEEVLKLSPPHLSANHNLGLIRLDRQDFNRAVGNYQAILKVSPHSENALTNLGLALLRLGRYADAAENFRSALRVKPGFAPAQQNLDYMISKGLVSGL